MTQATKEYPAFAPHGNLTPIQLGCMTRQTKQHINGVGTPSNSGASACTLGGNWINIP
jgi:hypothetical protein